MRRCLVLLGLIYFQLSTFALVQWLKEHADVHGGLPLPRMRRALEPADGLIGLDCGMVERLLRKGDAQGQ